MTVRDLINKLSDFDPNDEVFIPCQTGGRMEATSVTEEEGKVQLD